MFFEFLSVNVNAMRSYYMIRNKKKGEGKFRLKGKFYAHSAVILNLNRLARF